MTCRQCGTVIAEKALICYKCGTATTEALYAPVPIGRTSRSGGVATRVAIIVALLIGVYLAETATTSTVQNLGWVVVAAAAVALGGHLVMGRRR